MPVARKKRNRTHRKRAHNSIEPSSSLENSNINEKKRRKLPQTNAEAFLVRCVPPIVNKRLLQNIANHLQLPKIAGSSTREVAGRLVHEIRQLNGSFSFPTQLRKPFDLPQALLLFTKARKIVVVTGAGISTSLGIPDFRSFQGIYSQLTRSGMQDAQLVFHIDTFHQNPGLFYLVAHKIVPNGDRVSHFHKFVRLLDQKEKLLRVYTQNIDNLEAAAGIEPSKVVHCHGTLATSTCCTCSASFSGAATVAAIRQQKVPYCSLCVSDVSTVPLKGLIKPHITFFGEDVPAHFATMAERDLSDCDMLLVAGTSLKVEPVAGIVRRARHVPKVLVNRNRIPGFDVNFLGDCDDVSGYLCRQLEWKMQNAGEIETSKWSISGTQTSFHVRRSPE